MASIVFVCTGNLCRSPQAEQYFRAQSTKAQEEFGGLSIDVSSAGSRTRDGLQMPAPAHRWAENLGGDPSRHLSRQLTTEIVESADLLIALARDHRATIAKLSPRAARRTFTLLEFERIVTGSDGSSLADGPPDNGNLIAWRDHAAAHRGLFVGTPEADSVVDPIGLDEDTYERSARSIFIAVEGIIRTFYGTTHRAPAH